MNRLFYLFLTFVLLLVSCEPSAENSRDSLRVWMQPNGKLKVLSTIAMIDDLVDQIGGPYVDGITLIKGDLDPHSYQLVKGDDEKLAFADLIFYNGLGLEHGPSLQNFLHSSSKATALGDKLRESDPQAIILYKGQVDPHIWMDIGMWMKIVPYIVEALSQKDPNHVEEYRKNGEALLSKMSQVNEEVKNELQSIPSEKRYLVTTHDAFNYFTRAYLSEEGETDKQWQERFAAPEGLAPESQISSSDIQEILDHLTKYHIHVIFPESNVNRDSIRKIVQAGKEKGLELKIAEVSLYADAMGKPHSDGDGYLKMIRHNATSIAQLLFHNGKKDPL